jgi:hypothetical protein
VLEGIRPQIADEAKTAQFLASKDVVLNTEAQVLFLDCVLPEFIAAILRLEQLAGGNYEADERPSQFPKYDGRTVRPGNSMTPWALFDAWAKATQPAASTVNRWRSVFLDLDKRFSDARDITEADAREWARKLVTPDRIPVTVNDVWVTAARTIFGWAVGERMLTQNPFENVRVTESKKAQTSRNKSVHFRKDGDNPPCRVCDWSAKNDFPRRNQMGALALCLLWSTSRRSDTTSWNRHPTTEASPCDAVHTSGRPHEDAQAESSANPRTSDRARVHRVREDTRGGAALL